MCTFLCCFLFDTLLTKLDVYCALRSIRSKWHLALSSLYVNMIFLLSLVFGRSWNSDNRVRNNRWSHSKVVVKAVRQYFFRHLRKLM